MEMTTVEYSAWAEYADHNIRDIRAHMILSLIGTGIYNYIKKQDAPAFTPARFAPWIEWGAPVDSDDPLFHDRLGG